MTSLVAKSFTIFGKTTNAGAKPGTDALIFNNPAADDSKNPARVGAYILTLRRYEAEGIGNNQAAEIEDGNVQPLGLVEGTYVVTGFMSNMRGNYDDGANSIITLLRTWKNKAQVIDGQLEAGRLGIVAAGVSDNSVAPIETGKSWIGLMFEEFSKINAYKWNRVII